MFVRAIKFHTRRWVRKGTSGAAAIEMAMVMPLFLIFVLGVLAYGIYFGAAHSVEQLAADAARSSVAGLNATERAAISQAYVTNNAASYVLIRPDKLTVNAAQSTTDPNNFVVRLTYDARYLPIWSFAPAIAMPSSQIERSAVVRQGGAL